VNPKLLLDENISPWVSVTLSREDGFDACGVRDRGLLKASDKAVLEKAFIEDRILVTKNVKDFEKLARAAELHAGIVFIEAGDLVREEQL
jgi:predicted nuclease of predicted toxin-antitoxin system